MRTPPRRPPAPPRPLHRFLLPLLPLALSLLSLACAAPGPSRDTPPPPPPAADHLTLALVQYRIQGNQTAHDLAARVSTHTRAAAGAGARLVVFPEHLTLDAWPLDGPAGDDQTVVRRIAEEVTPLLVDQAAALADELGVALLVGGPRLHGAQVRNAAILLLPGGRRLLQDKLFLTAWEQAAGFTPGDELRVLDAPWGRTVVLVCFDVEFPAVSQALVPHQPELWLVPSMTESSHGLQRVRWTCKARAVEHHAFVAVAGTVGEPSADWRHFGHSVVFAPQEGPFHGVVAEAQEGRQEILLAGLDLAALRQARASARFYPARDQQARGRGVTVRRQRRRVAPRWRPAEAVL